MSEVLEVDAKIFFIEAVVTTKPHLFPMIDKVYEKYKYKAYKSAKSSKWYNHTIFCDGGIEKQIYSRKLLGLFNLAESNTDVCQDLIEIIKKGWKDLYYYIRKQEELDLSDAINKFAYKGISVNNINGICIILCTLAISMGIEIKQDKWYETLFQMLKQRLDYYDGKLFKHFNYNDCPNEIKEKAIQIKNRIFNEYGTIKYAYDVNELYSENDPDIKTYVKNMNILYETENLSFDFERLVSNRDVEEICAVYWMTYRNQNLQQSVRYLVNGLFLKYTEKEFNKVKDYYFKNNKETLYLDMQHKDEKIEELTTENESLKRQIERLNSEINTLKYNYKKSLETEINQLKQQINKFQDELSKTKQHEQELFQLREFVFEQEYSDNNIETDNTNKEITIPNVKCLIVGGHENWRNKLKEELPDSFKFLAGDKANFDLQYINDVKLVIFNVAYMNHATYYRIINFCRKRNIKFYFISNQTTDIIKPKIAKIVGET